MIKSLLVAGASAIALSLSASAAAQELVDPEPMTWPAMGFDPADLDTSIDPGDDFFAFVNGKWDAATPIPPQYSSYGVVTDLRLKADRQIGEIIADMSAGHAPMGSTAQRVGDSYTAYLDTDAINAKGMAAAQPYLDRIFGIENYEDLAHLFAAPGMPDPFLIHVHADINNPDANILNWWLGGYSLPDRDNYLADSEKNREMQAKYKEYLAFLLGKVGYADPVAAAEAVYRLEYNFAALDFDRTLSRNPELLDNFVSRADLVKMAGDFPLQVYFDDLKVGNVETLVVDEMPPSPEKIAQLGFTSEDLAKLGAGMPGAIAMIDQVPLATWKAWAAAQFMQNYATMLPSDVDEANFDFWGKFMSGRQLQRKRDQRSITLVQNQLGEAVGELYVERHFPPAAKTAMVELVANLRKAMAERIDGLDWMSDATKREARAKLDAFTVKIGYPDEFETYEGLEVSADDPIGNAVSASKWQWNDLADKLGKPVDRTEWGTPPQTVNAYYSPTRNEIVFPAGYLQPPNFSLTADPAVNYAAIGSTIGHEISHGFDDSGSKFDGTGKLRNWWTAEDRAKFEAEADGLAAQYDAFCPIDDGKTCINGRLTMGENLADLAGITIAYRAYRMSLNGMEAPVTDGLTGDQRFFIAYAIGNREKWTEELTREILQTDPHSPDKARTNIILQNFDPWYAAFNVTEDDALYLPPEKRVRIW